MVVITVIILEAKDYCVKIPDVTLLTSFKVVPCLRLFEYSRCHSMLSPTVMLCQPQITTIILGDTKRLVRVFVFELVSLLIGKSQLKLGFPSGSSPQRETHRRGVFSL